MKKPLPKELLDISLDNLETTAAKLPQALFLWGTELAGLRRDVKLQKNKVTILKATLDNQIRSSPQSYALEKITEKGVESCVLSHPEYQEAQKALTDLEYDEDVLQEFVRALSAVKSEITDLATLHGQMYWSKADTGGKVSNNAQQSVAREASEATNVNQNKKMPARKY